MVMGEAEESASDSYLVLPVAWSRRNISTECRAISYKCIKKAMFFAQQRFGPRVTTSSPPYESKDTNEKAKMSRNLPALK